MDLGQALIDVVARNHNTLGLGLLLLSACIEYVFPPFPGDMITVFGAFLVARKGWNGPAVFGAVTVGSAIGCMLDYGLGRALESRRRPRPRLDRLVERFHRHGALYLTINRFVPSVRALFFVAAGLARLPWWEVLAFGTLSAVLWNGLLLVLGLTLGHSWQRLFAIVQAYSVTFIAVACVAGICWFLWRRRRR